ncbi:pre-mRNA-splicing factor CWC25 homolog [Cephus cinctus]|uniref:Pre-mRNA-splicing factor CWC25 homolog n=1 Tax=Cephus cinctus TaxID=211228 RepID=A0AAJ7FTN1_CEPCN|nr:pre-mRNA-splicing factor CWC25 homolog [Cephus cinctus]
MGGGDLNLKKSWHPSTMKNMEKVWKAEQQDHQEKKRIAELKREIEMEKDREDMTKYAMDQGVIEKKDEKKLDWMYKGPNQSINREDYLLGKAIDKPFEQLAQAEKDGDQNRMIKNHVEYECIPPSLRFFSGSEQVDLARKLQEDPLYAIKKKEMETRTQLLKNPVKLKQLKQLLEQQAKESKAEKSKKKNKKKNKHGSDNSDSDDKLDILLAAKYKKLKDKISKEDLIKSMKKRKKEKKRKSKDESSDSEVEKKDPGKQNNRHKHSKIDVSTKNQKQKKYNKRKPRESSSSSDSSSSSEEEKDPEPKRKHKDSRNLHERHSDLKQKISDRSRGRSPQTRSYGPRKEESIISRKNSNHFVEESDEDRHAKHSSRKNYGLVRADGSKLSPSTKSSKSARRDSSTDKKKPRKEEQRWVPPKRQKLTEEEKERRRQEMMANASWRDKEREWNVKRYREEDKKEQTDKSYNKDFIRKQLAVAADVGTVESRIRSNINNIQRSGRAMDTNFAKR